METGFKNSARSVYRRPKFKVHTWFVQFPLEGRLFPKGNKQGKENGKVTVGRGNVGLRFTKGTKI